MDTWQVHTNFWISNEFLTFKLQHILLNRLIWLDLKSRDNFLKINFLCTCFKDDFYAWYFDNFRDEDEDFYAWYLAIKVLYNGL